MADVVGKSTTLKNKTGKIQKQGHTAGPYGNDPNVMAKGVAGKAPRDLTVK